jgi:CubicO group peptidase (beta-lactamase class C family)
VFSARSFIAVLLASAPVLQPLAATAGAQGPVSADTVSALFTRTFSAYASPRTPGCVVGVSRGAEPPLVRAFGMANLELPVPLDTGSVFEAGSVSKQFTAAAVLLLARDGTLRLTDPVRRWVPELPERFSRITVAHLLHHQSGLREWSDLVELAGWPRGLRAHRRDDAMALLVRQRGLNFEPGQEYLYSNSNYVLATLVIERASGKPFAEVTRTLIFGPLGMTRTSWREDFSRIVPGRAQGWSPTDSTTWQLDMPFERLVGPGGLLTTVGDLMRWQASFRTGALGGPGFVQQMEAVGVLATGQPTTYASGLVVTTVDGERVVSHGGATAGYRSFVGRVPSRGVALALLCNNGDIDSESLGESLLMSVAGLRESQGARVALVDSAAQPARAGFAGLYRSTRTRQPVQVRLTAAGIALGGTVEFVEVGPQRFRNAALNREVEFLGGTRTAASGYLLRIGTWDSVRFVREAPWQPDAKALAAYAGEWTSDETDGTWTITRRGDTLHVTGLQGDGGPLVPRYRDTFSSPGTGWLATFTRDARGRVTGLLLGAGRTRTVTFRRVPPT